MTTREIIQSGYYDLKSVAFQCNADAIGVGRLFDFPHKDVDGENVAISVLARDSMEAMEIFKTFLRSARSGTPCGLETKQCGVR